MSNLEKELTKKHNQVPALRFQGFVEGWEHDLLGNRVEFFSGLTYSPSDVVKRNGTLVLRSSNIQDGEVVNADNVYVNSNVVNSKNVDVGDIAVVVRNGSRHLIGKHAMVTEEMQNTVIGAFMTGVISETPSFTNALLNTNQFKKEIDKNLGATINQITTGSFRNMEFYFTSKDESLKIGNFFKQLDTNLTQHKTQLEKLKNLKQAMLQKMFPQNGAPLPEIRFKGFEGEWKKTTIEEIAERYDNLRIPITAKDRISGSTPYYGANGIQDYVEGFTHEGEFILVAEDGANDLHNYPIQYVSGKIWVNNHAHVLQGKKDIDNVFLSYALTRINFEQFLVGGGRAKLNANTMMELVLIIPNKFEEQQKIGNYFQKLDQLINQQQTQLNKLKQIKQACLEQMFV